MFRDYWNYKCKKLFTKESFKKIQKKNILIYKQSISLLSNKPFKFILIYIKVRHQSFCVWKIKKKKKFSTIMPPVSRTTRNGSVKRLCLAEFPSPLGSPPKYDLLHKIGARTYWRSSWRPAWWWGWHPSVSAGRWTSSGNPPSLAWIKELSLTDETVLCWI